jgi:addiction module HigA family antidote
LITQGVWQTLEFRLQIIWSNYTGTGKEHFMTNYIPTPTIGEILKEEFMEPLNISAYKLAQSIHVPTSRIQDILHDRRKITADTSLRLAKFFGVSDRYFLDMQTDIDIRNLKISMADEISQIKVCG